jgi:hypothetical protein
MALLDGMKMEALPPTSTVYVIMQQKRSVKAHETFVIVDALVRHALKFHRELARPVLQLSALPAKGNANRLVVKTEDTTLAWKYASMPEHIFHLKASSQLASKGVLKNNHRLPNRWPTIFLYFAPVGGARI